MKKFIAVVAFIACANLAYAKECDEVKHTINVSGYAEKKVEPDQVDISLQIVTKNKKFDLAKNRNNDIARSLVRLADKLKIDKNDIKSENFNLRPEYQRCQYKEQVAGRCDPLKILYYHVERGFNVRIKDFALYDKFITRALELGVTNINYIQFGHSKMSEFKDALKADAAKNAKQQADLVAGTLSVEVGKPTRIDISQTHYPQPVYRHREMAYMKAGAMADSGGSTVAPGQLKIATNVKVTFELK